MEGETNEHLAPGALIAERYRVESLLGEGGMGVVYLAEHIHMRKRVALKVLLRAWCETPEIVARFEREAVAAGSINHPNVVAATDFGRLPDGSFFLVLEYIAGTTLRGLVQAGPILPARAVPIVRGVLSAIGAAHAHGVVHRDLKPENIMLVDRDGDPDFVKVLDFGIAKTLVDDAAPAPDDPGRKVLTRVGAVLGTPDYMAPEQAMGQAIDARADLYAVGVILYEMLTGECPFRGGAVTVLRQHVLSPAPPLPSAVGEAIDPRLAAIVTRLLQKDPGARFASAAEVIAALDTTAPASLPSPQTAAETASTIAPPAPAVTFATGGGWVARHLTRRRAIVLGASSAALLAALLVAAGSDTPGTAPRATRPIALADGGAEPEQELELGDQDPAPAPSLLTPPGPTAVASSAPSTPPTAVAAVPRGKAKPAQKKHGGPGVVGKLKNLFR